VAIVAIALLAVLNLGIVLLNNSDTSPGGRNPLPVTVQSVSPEPGSIAVQDDLVERVVLSEAVRPLGAGAAGGHHPGGRHHQ